MGAQWRKRGKPQYAGPHLRFSGCAGRRSARLSLLPRIQIIPARRLKCALIRLFSLGFLSGLLFMRFFSLPGDPPPSFSLRPFVLGLVLLIAYLEQNIQKCNGIICSTYTVFGDKREKIPAHPRFAGRRRFDTASGRRSNQCSAAHIRILREWRKNAAAARFVRAR